MTAAHHYLSLAAVSTALGEGSLSSVELTTASLARIEELDPGLGAFYTVFADSALEEARNADRDLARGQRRGPLQGVPIALKDLIELGPTSAGSALRRGQPAASEGSLVRALKAQGSVILGKLATHEFGLSTQTFADALPPARNPWNRELTPGGSSTGAGVALAAGLAFGAYGTDTGGSVRLPAANCSIVGLKPTFGLIGRSGIVPLSWSLDHAGPMARTVADVRILLEAVLGPDPDDSGSTSRQPATGPEPAGIEGLRVGVPRLFWEPSCAPPVRSCFETALKVLSDLGAEVEDIDLGISLEEVVATGYLIALTEGATLHADDIRRRGGLYGREFKLLMESGLLISGSAYLNAQRARAVLAGRVGTAFQACSVLALPTLGALPDPIPALPKRIDRRISTSPAPAYTWLANLYGGPAISIPAGFSAGGIPIGLQLLAPPYEDFTVLRVAAAHELAAGLVDRHPLP